jgi:alpha/beta superfamily hydrolase
MIWWFFFGVTGGYLCLFFYVWYRFRAALHIHVSENKENKRAFAYLPTREVTFQTKDGVTIAALYLPVRKAKAAVILLHGYETALGGKPLLLGHAAYLSAEGYSTLLIDFRSVGNSTGKAIKLGTKEWQDAEAAYDYLRALPELKDKCIGFLGVSFGASVAINTVGLTQKGDFLIASVPSATFAHLFAAQIKAEGLPVFLVLPLLKLVALMELGRYWYYDPLRQISKVHVPLLIIGAKDDTIVFPQDAAQLYETAQTRKSYWEAACGHDVFRFKQEEFRHHVLQFLRQWGKR